MCQKLKNKLYSYRSYYKEFSTFLFLTIIQIKKAEINVRGVNITFSRMVSDIRFPIEFKEKIKTKIHKIKFNSLSERVCLI